MRRRALLGSAATLLTAASSGCLTSVQDTLDSSIRLGGVAITNYDLAPHRFHVRITRDGEIVHESTHDVRGRSESTVYGPALERTWGDVAGSYVLYGRSDDGPWVERSVDDALDGAPGCASARGVYDDLGSDEFEWYVRAECDRVSE